MIRRYSELCKLNTFEERYQYLKLSGTVGYETFGFDRFMNQAFYKSREWLRVKDLVIVRDTINGYCCDLGDPDHPIFDIIIVHHMNPILPNDIKFSTEYLLNPEYLISTIHSTHNAIHYGDESQLPQDYIPRVKNDTSPWKH